MSKPLIGLGAAAVVALALALAFSGHAPAAEGSGLEGKAAPDFTLPTLDGKEVKLSALKGNVVLIDFWATWCPPCRKSLPNIQKLSADQTLAGKGLRVWGVNARETKEKVQKFMDDNKFTFTVPMDKGAAMDSYKVQGIPTTVVVNRDGTVAKVFVGFGGEESEKALREAIDAALAKGK